MTHAFHLGLHTSSEAKMYVEMSFRHRIPSYLGASRYTFTMHNASCIAEKHTITEFSVCHMLEYR